ncbi:uncharacterized protein BP5553_00617 [Venustampulla echinocandica]|uniref:TM7S3/TM198-like domain-containing protein n=1 Tax=Venustampulla echinocandica TaxID=2656787 RepID=A0A370TYP9_9HELO|nr:uncharacterized protein BP5553_00617 [Venustampulla echinocandica]RDL40638.1 hypothetical protein BP5553_00617 [Venustampulla echinocandica]
MVQVKGPKVLAVLLLFFCVNFAVADRRGVRIQRRDDSPNQSIVATSVTPVSPSSPATTSNESSQKGGNNSGNNGGDSTTANTPDKTISETAKRTTTNASSASPTEESISNSATTSSTGAVVTPSIIGAATTSTGNPSAFNSTTTPDKLPIAPSVTPGFGVAGAILMISGVVYTLVGIKNKLLHIFLSAAYLASLSVTVLILYVMNLPVGNAVQGAYVVAATMTGLILGGGAIVFADMTEGLGCLLGGFSLSMWLLSLKAGGLLTATSGKAIFITAFTLAVFATSFSHHTRPYGLIGSISFSGATVVVIGIDCFSRAGLKEFWAWIWDLNPNLFPLGADTYPLTRGIRVEIAVIIVIFLMGIISQMKLWKIIKERREQRAAERLDDERVMEQEEENVGRRIENLNAGERSQWEAAYGNKEQADMPSAPSHRDSGVGDMESQRKGQMSIVTSTRHSREDGIEMSQMPSPTQATPIGLVMANKSQDTGIPDVQVTPFPGSSPELVENGNIIEPLQNRQSHASLVEEGKAWLVGSNGEARLERTPSKRLSSRTSSPPVSTRNSRTPEIVPLPFKVPVGEVEDDRSSVVALAEDEEELGRPTRQSNRISAGSAIMRRLSKRSLLSPSPRSSKRFSMGHGQSTEDLVIPYEVDDDRASSVAATIDGLSDEERSPRSSIDEAPNTNESRVEEFPASPREDQLEAAKLDLGAKSTVGSTENKSTGQAEVGITTPDSQTLRGEKAEDLSKRQSFISGTDPNPKGDLMQDAELAIKTQPNEVKTPRAARSTTSTSESRRMSLTKDRLPAPLPRVAMSYRTNEWAKHLSNAETPEVEELKLEEGLDEGDSSTIEMPAPVNVEDLQQTAEQASPLAPRPSSSTSQTVPLALSRSASTPTIANNFVPNSGTSSLPQANTLSRSVSQQSLQSQSASNRFRISSSPAIPQPIVESPVEESFAPHTPPAGNLYPSQNAPFGSTNTLIGKRDSMMRNKSYQTAQFPLPSTPELSTNFSSPYQSQYQSRSASRAGSDAGSIYNYQNNMSKPILMEDDDNISLSARRELIRQSSLHQTGRPAATLLQPSLPFDSHQPLRQSSAPSPSAREQQLASFRASIMQDMQNTAVPKMNVERQRSALWQERQVEEQRRALEAQRRGEFESAFDERMRRGDMLDIHRDALRKMQARASRNV